MEQKQESFWDTLRFIVIALAIVIPFRIFVAQPFIVSGESMVPTFQNHNYLIIDELSYRFSAPDRGDVVVFKYPYDKKRYFIKRIIALPGETIQFKGNDVIIKNKENPKGFTLDEPYIEHDVVGNKSVTLSDDEFFVMGDNRPASSDSRFWGPLKKKYLKGRPIIRLYPFNEIDLFPGSHRAEFNSSESELNK